MITQTQLKEEVLYCPISGSFKWLRRRQGRRFDKPAAKLCADGYSYIRINGYSYLAHRVAWLYVHGQWPYPQIDHINRCKSDNRIFNLRIVTPRENALNIDPKSNSTSGYVGVHFDKRRKYWRAHIRLANGQYKELGRFGTKREAIDMRNDWESREAIKILT